VQPVCEAFFDPIDQARGPEPERLNRSVRGYLAEVERYLLKLHEERVPARRINEERTDLFDRLIRKLFRVSEDGYHARFPRLDFRIAILAVGGFGRRELALASDLDLVILYRGKMNPYVETIAESITYRLWDARLQVACATRTIVDCIRVGEEDLSTMTSYLDTRFLIGDAGLAAEFERTVHEWFRRNSVSFIQGKLEEQAQRHERYGESPNLLQPNVRESVGGLRDGHTALWVARAAHWPVRRPEDLHVHGFVDATELDVLLSAFDFLWRIRNELHREGRRDDRLHFAAQEKLAAFLEFEGGDGLLPVERFMQAYYLHARGVQRVSGRIIDHACRLAERRVGRGSAERRAVEDGFVLVEDRLEIPHPQMIEERPVRLLSVFAVAQRYEVALSTRAQRTVREHLHLLDEGFRRDPEAATVFRDILRAPNRVYRTLSAMNQLGVLGLYLPEFGDLVGLWQQDLYHTYTVDAHSLFLVEQLRRLEKGRFEAELPLATELVREQRRRDVLFLGCLLHDIGKGKGGGHSERGAKMIPEIGKRLGLTEEETEEVAFLVRYHLHMSGLAERRDVNDPRLILNLAQLVENRRRLRNLYLLTVADIRSVSAEAWTEWKGGLLEALYRNTADWLETEISDEAAPRYFLERSIERAADVERETLRLLAGQGIPEDRARTFLDTLPKRYLLLHQAHDIAVHVRAALDYMERGERVGVELHHGEGEEGATCELVLFTADRLGLVSIVSGLLTAAGRNILSAYVYTTRGGLAMEIYRITGIGGGRLEEERERARIEARILEVLEGRRSADPFTAARASSSPLPARVQPSVVRISNEDSDLYSIIDVEAHDRPGLLYSITHTLAEVGLNVVMSRVSTRASRVKDAFYVTEGGHRILDPDRQEEIRHALLHAVEQRTE
jgi:[protein-PII] uridylyltransferase